MYADGFLYKAKALEIVSGAKYATLEIDLSSLNTDDLSLILIRKDYNRENECVFEKPVLIHLDYLNSNEAGMEQKLYVFLAKIIDHYHSYLIRAKHFDKRIPTALDILSRIQKLHLQRVTNSISKNQQAMNH